MIWCEDHGDLAFFDGSRDAATVDDFGGNPGDYVRFDLHEGRQLRRARNPVLVAADEYPALVDDLKQAGLARPSASSGAGQGAPTGKVVPIRPIKPLKPPKPAVTRRERPARLGVRLGGAGILHKLMQGC